MQETTERPLSGRRVVIYDTTLRDGAQAEGISFTVASKLKICRRLDEFGIDYIEGGYAGSNRKDMEFFSSIAKMRFSHAKLVAFGSTRRVGMPVRQDKFVASLLAAGTKAVTVVGKSWLLHVRRVLRTSRKENLAMISDTIEYLKDRGRTVFFDAEHFFDGYKENPDATMETIAAAERAGADAVVLCDTNGGSLPHEVYEITRSALQAVSIPVGIHTHNDAGVAVANALEAVRAGATHVQGTINGIGERCGNANLCSIIPALRLKMGYDCLTRADLTKLTDLSSFVGEVVNWRPDDKAPYVGRSAFAHKGGTHVNAVKKIPRSFEHIPPESVGNRRRILVSELSGGANVLLKAVELGMGRLRTAEGAREILARLKELESKGYTFEAADASFKILMQKVLKEHKSFFELEGFRVIVEKRGKDEPCISEATIKVRVNKEVEQTVAEGEGPVHALDKALRKALLRFYPEISKVLLTDFHVAILDPDLATGATTRVLIESSDGSENWGTVGVSANIIEAAWQGLVDSIEYKLFKDEKGQGHRGANAARCKAGKAV